MALPTPLRAKGVSMIRIKLERTNDGAIGDAAKALRIATCTIAR